jgi:hypothetical protein
LLRHRWHSPPAARLLARHNHSVAGRRRSERPAECDQAVELQDEIRPDAAHATESVLAHEWSAHHPIRDDAFGDRRCDARQRVELRRRGDVDVEFAADGTRIAGRRAAPASSTAALLGAALAATLLVARRICRRELMLERRLSDERWFAGCGAHDPHAGSKNSDGANERQGFVIGA